VLKAAMQIKAVKQMQAVQEVVFMRGRCSKRVAKSSCQSNCLAVYGMLPKGYSGMTKLRAEVVLIKLRKILCSY
jgi:hypothetical protein